MRVVDWRSMEKGMYFKPEMKDFALHNEYEDDGDNGNFQRQDKTDHQNAQMKAWCGFV